MTDPVLDSLSASHDLEGRPRISVVVPVRDRRRLLGSLIDALDAQTWRDFEVIVVDDGSSDGTGDSVRIRSVAGQPVTVIEAGGVGAVGARRLGVAQSRGEVLAFTDSDCRPKPGWLAAGMKAIEGGSVLVHGPTRPARPLEPFERSMWTDDDGLYPTCNLLVPRWAYDQFGGFSETRAQMLGFRPGGRAKGLGFGEDTLFGWDVRRAGLAVEYVEEAEVEHHIFPPDLADSLSRSWQGGAFPALVRQVPELRDTFLRYRVLLGSPRRVPFYLVVLGLLTRQRRMAWVSGAWWVAWRARDLRRTPVDWRTSLRWLPAEMAVDAFLGTALVVGSARSRTLVL